MTKWGGELRRRAVAINAVLSTFSQLSINCDGASEKVVWAVFPKKFISHVVIQSFEENSKKILFFPASDEDKSLEFRQEFSHRTFSLF